MTRQKGLGLTLDHTQFSISLCYRTFICCLFCETDSELQISIEKVIRGVLVNVTDSREGKEEEMGRGRSPCLMKF